MKKNNAVRFAAVCCAAMLSVGVVPVVADTPSLSVSVSAETLSAPKNIKTNIQDNRMIVTWDKVEGATAYKIEIKHKGGDWQPLPSVSTVKSNKVYIPYLKYNETINVRITPLKKTSSGYSNGTPVTFKRRFNCKKITVGKNNVPVIDTSLIGKSASYIEKQLGDIDLTKDKDGHPYGGRYYYSKDKSAALCFDENKILYGIYIWLPVDSWSAELKNDLEKTYGNTYDGGPDEGGDFSYHWNVSGKTWLQASTQVWEYEDYSDEVMFFWFSNGD